MIAALASLASSRLAVPAMTLAAGLALGAAGGGLLGHRLGAAEGQRRAADAEAALAAERQAHAEALAAARAEEIARAAARAEADAARLREAAAREAGLRRRLSDLMRETALHATRLDSGCGLDARGLCLARAAARGEGAAACAGESADPLRGAGGAGGGGRG